MSSKTKHKHKKKSEIVTENLAPVNEAVKEYRVIEDGAYAYHLQNKEIEYHYSQNIRTRQTVMEDIRKAKELQDEEDRKARIMTLDEQREIKEMDEELAEIIQEEIFQKSVQEEQERKEREERDKELALLMEEKERRKTERSEKSLVQDQVLAARLQQMNVNPSPPRSRDEQRMRLMTDEELAKRLQDEERLKVERMKKKKEEMKSVVQMQDEELAKYIHERDIEAAEKKFSKERAKRKSKKKGKWDDEPLYYDDNITPPDRRPGYPEDRDPRLQREPPHRPREPPHHPGEPSWHDDPRRYPREPQPRHPRDRHERNPGERRPERPPPPQFPDSHRTEVKLPLDHTQQERRHQQEASRRHAANGRDSPSNPESRRAYSEKNRQHRGSADSLENEQAHRSYSERPNHKYPQDGRRPHGQPKSYHNAGDRSRRDDRVDPRSRNPDHSRQNGAHHIDDMHRRGTPPPGNPVPKPRGKMTHDRSMPEPGNISRR